MKKLIISILILTSAKLGAQKIKYAERYNANTTIDSFYVKLGTDSVFNYSGDGFVAMTLAYYKQYASSVIPSGFANYTQNALGIWVNQNTILANSTIIPPSTQTALDTKLATNGNGSSLTGITTSQVAASVNKNFVTDAQLTVIGNTSGVNSGDNAANTTYANDYRAGNFVAGTNYLAPNGSAALLTNFPTLNQNTTGSAATLTTPRTINGIAFNGSANISIPSDIAASNLGNVMTSNGTVWTSAVNNGGWTVLRVAGSAATNNTTSLADITGLVTGTLLNATKYEIEVTIDATVSAVTTGITYAIATAGTGGASIVNVLVSGTTTTNAGQVVTISTAGAATAAFVTSSGANGTIVMKGFVTTRGSGTATISVQQAKPTSGTATAQVGSVMRYRVAQ